MFYTNRRANDTLTTGVTWVHGTRIGIAESSDNGITWKYRDTADIQYRLGEFSHWAPEVIEYNNLYHMYLTYVPGIFNDWKHPRNIVHLTSSDLIHWKYVSILKLSSDKVIDACVFKMPDKTWRMWYNNEADKKSIYYADSPDLYNWTDKGKAVADKAGEGPNVFKWKNKYWMIIDNWKGLGVYFSDDLLNWTRQANSILDQPGKGEDDEVMGGHASIVVNKDRAYLFYFTHPGRKPGTKPKNIYDSRRSSIQVVELEFKDGIISCDRDKPVYINLSHKNINK
jgi:beta-xylosidase